MNNAQIGDKILAYDNEQTAEINELKKNKVDYIGEKIENTSLNNLSPGTYYAPTSAVKDTITELPEGLPNSGFRMDVFNNGASANIQVLTSFSPSKPVSYTRAFNSGNWGEWIYGTVDLTLKKGYETIYYMPSRAINISTSTTKPIDDLGMIEIEVSRDGARVFVTGSIYASLDKQVGNLTFMIDGKSTERLDSASSSLGIVKMTPTTIVLLDKGTHTIQFGAYTQSTEATMTIPSWNNASLTAFEI